MVARRSVTGRNIRSVMAAPLLDRSGDAIVVTPAAYFALPLQPYLAPESIFDRSGLTQTPMWRTLVRPDSSGHLLLWEPVTDLMGSYRSAVESRFVEDVWVVDVRPLL